MSPRLVGVVRRVNQGQFPVRFHGEGRAESSLRLFVPSEPGQRDPLALPGRYVVGPCRQGRFEQGQSRSRTLAPFIRPGERHTDLSPCRCAIPLVHQVAVENHHATFAEVLAAGRSPVADRPRPRGGECDDPSWRRGRHRAARTRQMATDAVVIAASILRDSLRKAAAPIAMALQTVLPEVGGLLARFGQPMRIVAGDTPKAALARAEATALVHLLDMVDELILRSPGSRDAIQN